MGKKILVNLVKQWRAVKYEVYIYTPYIYQNSHLSLLCDLWGFLTAIHVFRRYNIHS